MTNTINNIQNDLNKYDIKENSSIAVQNFNENLPNQG